MVVDRVGVERALRQVLPLVPKAETRLVGTASSVLRGIDLRAADIDILFRTRAGVDAWFEVLSADRAVETAPSWMADARQYFARVYVDEVAVELSTVEIDTDSDTAECIGTGPWRHFDLLSWGDGILPAVASELRLITEVGRGREDRYRPIQEFLRTGDCDLALITRGLAQLGISQSCIDQMVERLSPKGRR
jgi:hypothetical protein